MACQAMTFLSTLSLRRATCAGRPQSGWTDISIHALLAESDTTATHTTAATKKFLSTLSLRRATMRSIPTTWRRPHFYPRSPCGERRAGKDPQDLIAKISIHALLAESDRDRRIFMPKLRYFYPRSPCGERPFWTSTAIWATRFLSTLSLRRATAKLGLNYTVQGISIHALLAESDLADAEYLERTNISIHALLAESDQ